MTLSTREMGVAARGCVSPIGNIKTVIHAPWPGVVVFCYGCAERVSSLTAINAGNL
jgi:hypothetical protein